MTKIWVNESRFVEIDGGDKKTLADEFAPRSRSVDWMGVFGFLPDPDEVLQKLGLDLTAYRSLLSDAHVGACYISRKSGTLSCEWDIREPAGNLKRVNARVMDAVVGFMEKIDVHQVMTDMLEAPFFGMAPIESVWKSENGQWLPDRVQGKPAEWFAYTEDNELRFKSKENMIEGEKLPPYRFITVRHHASYQNPYGDRLLSRCFWPVAFKRGGWKFWSIFAEKYGMPWVIGRVPRSTNQTERAALLSNLASMVQDAVAVINNDESIEIKESSGKSASSDVYDKLISGCNREVSKAVLGQTLSTELDKGGSYAAAQSHLEVRKDLVDQDKKMVSQGMNLLLQWATELNFYGAQAPEFVFVEDEDLQTERAERDGKLKDQGVRFTKVYYSRRYNLEEDEFEISEPQEPPFGGTIVGARSIVPLPGEYPNMGPQYAESRRFTPDQQALEDMIDEAMPMAAAARDAATRAVLDAVQSASDYDDLQDRLAAALADQMPAADFEDLMARVMTAAHMWGRSQK